MNRIRKAGLIGLLAMAPFLAGCPESNNNSSERKQDNFTFTEQVYQEGQEQTPPQLQDTQKKQPTQDQVRMPQQKAQPQYQNIPVSYKTNDFSADSDEVILARMLFGEARNCSNTEKIAIAYTAINRAHDQKRWNGTDIKSAVLAKWQYSCFNSNDPNRQKLLDPERYNEKAFNECLILSRDILSGKYSELNFGQTHYHTLNVNPKWASSSTMKKFGRINTEKGQSAHIFYREN